MKILICKCNSCTHWEIGEDFILCKTCNLKVPAKILVDLHDSVTHLHLEEETNATK